MKWTHRLLMHLTAMCTALGTPVAAQEAAPTMLLTGDRTASCGTVVTPEEVSLARDIHDIGLDTPASRFAPRYGLVVKTKLLVFRNQSNITLDDFQLTTIMNSLNAWFAAWGVRFEESEPRSWAYNDAYYQIVGQNEINAVFDIYNSADTLNLYFVPGGLSPHDGPVWGYATLPSNSRQGIIVAHTETAAYGNNQNLVHQVLHFFGVYHTHETAFGPECPNGIFCDSYGDLVCDTPADPGLDGRTNSSCLLNDALPPAPSGCFPPIPYAPDLHNIMSFTFEDCATSATQGQRDRFLSIAYILRQNVFAENGNFGVSWTDFSRFVPGDGTYSAPFNALPPAITSTPDGGRIVLMSSNSQFTGTITKALRLDSWRGRSTIGR